MIRYYVDECRKRGVSSVAKLEVKEKGSFFLGGDGEQKDYYADIKKAEDVFNKLYECELWDYKLLVSIKLYVRDGRKWVLKKSKHL